MSEIRVPSTELQGERTSVDVDFRNEQDKQHPQMANTVEPNVENAKHEHHPRQCQPPNVPFSSEKFTEIYLKLDTLKNLDTVELPRPGEFVIRVTCMGQVYGHFPSGNVNLQSSTYYTRSDDSYRRRSPDILLEHDMTFRMRFKDLVDNPLVFQLCHDVGDRSDPETYSTLPPMAFICLDVGQLLNYRVGKVSEHVEPWIIPENKTTGVTQPLLKLSVECSAGLPDTNQLLQGNLMTILCEGLHNLPGIVQQNVSSPESLADAQVFMSLPFTHSDPVLRFPGGKYRDAFLAEPTSRKMSLSQTDDTTQTGASLSTIDHFGEANRRDSIQDGDGVKDYDQNPTPKEPRYWASVKENSPDIPMDATAMAGDTQFDPIEYGGDGELEIFGDGREDFMEFSETGEPRLVWNSIHRKYLTVDTYRGMLGRLSQNAVWPIEISVAVVKKKLGKKKAGGGAVPTGTKNVYPTGGTGETQVSQASSNGSDDRMIMAELGQQSSAGAFDYTLVYHGVAFVDLSCLVYPGMKSARFSCKVYPFSTEMLEERTCVTNSALPEPLLMSLSQKSSGESVKSSNNARRAPPVPSVGNNGVQNSTNKSIRPSQSSNPIEGSHPDNQSKQYSSFVRKTEFTDGLGINNEGTSGSGPIERSPFIVFRIAMLRSIVPSYKAVEISKGTEEYLPKRDVPRPRLMNASSAQQKYRRGILEAAAEISREFSEHYWKDVLQNGQTATEQSSSSVSSNETIKNGFVSYLNASGRYLVIREHLRSSILNVVQQKCLNLRPSGFNTHRDFQSYLHDMYMYLNDEMKDALSSVTLEETDPLKSSLDRLLQQPNCAPEKVMDKVSLHNKHIADLGIFAEESFAQGDFETCHRLHLQRICRDKESSRCWTEFGMMWLSRGDDRMGKISVEEALRKDPLNLFALLISGMMSVRRGDEKGLECLSTALGILPMSPEILVINGIANSLMGNDIGADYYFRKAAYVHRTITGQPIDDVENLFMVNNAKKPFDMRQFSRDMDEGVPYLQEVPSDLQQAEVDTQAQGKKGGTPDKKQTTLKSSANQSVAENAEGLRKTNKSSAGLTYNTSKTNASTTDNSPETRHGSKNESNFTSLLSPAPSGSNVPFMESLSDISLEEVDLPLLATSIQSPHNVTLYSEKLEQHLMTIDYLENSRKKVSPSVNKETQEEMSRLKSKGDSNKLYVPEDDGVAPDYVIIEEYDKIINNSEGTGGLKSGVASVSAKPHNVGMKTNTQGKGDTADEIEGGQSMVPSETVFFISPSESNTEKAPATQNPKMTDRLGTELIWAANLLVNLRLFDFADGVLAKHLYFYGKRTVQFLYLRALSLHLQQRDAEALTLIKEAIEYDNTNGIYYALEGHCYYVMGNTQEAISSYEKALRLPHTKENRHLLYLRYGSLVLGQGKSKTAKRVFTYGVGKYPTPCMWLALGKTCFQRQEYDQAESAFAAITRLDTTNPIAWGHVSLASLMLGKKSLAEESYKWAVRYGLKDGILLEKIQNLQREKGFGDPSFPRIPACVPHDYYLRRMGRMKPFNLYKEELNQDPPRMQRSRYEETANGAMFQKISETNVMPNEIEEWVGEGEYEDFEMPTAEEITNSSMLFPNPTQSTGFSIQSRQSQAQTQSQSAPAELLTVKSPSQTPVQENVSVI